MSSIFVNDSSLNRKFVLCMLFLVSLLLLDSQTTWLKKTRIILTWFQPVVEAPAYTPSRLSQWISTQLVSRQLLLKENERLQGEVLQSQRRLQKFASLAAENIRLKELLGSSSALSDSVLVSEIIGVDTDPFSHKIILNKGVADGVFVGMPIIDARGLMGQTISVNQFSSQGLLITDPRHGMSVEVVRNGVRAIALGTGSLAEVSLSHLANTTDIEVGDVVVSSGLGGRFPQGYPVGIVSSVRPQPGKQYAEVYFTPLASLDRSRHVLLVFKESAEWQNTWGKKWNTLEENDILDAPQKHTDVNTQKASIIGSQQEPVNE